MSRSLGENWSPLPSRLMASASKASWNKDHPAPDLCGWVWALRQLEDNDPVSVRDLACWAGWGTTRAARILLDVQQVFEKWNGRPAPQQAQFGTATLSRQQRDSSATAARQADADQDAIVDEERDSSATPPQHQRDIARAFNSSQVQEQEHPLIKTAQQPPAAPPPGPPSAVAEVESDLEPSGDSGEMEAEPPVGSKTEQPPKRDTPKEVWEQLQAIRKEQEPKARGQELTTARRANLRSRMAELLKAKLTREDLLLAARWVYTSANLRAEGARKTGDPLETLLRPKHCVSYVELALKEQDQGSTSVEASKPQGLTAQQIKMEKGRAYLFDLNPNSPRYGEYSAEAVIAMETGIYPTIH